MIEWYPKHLEQELHRFRSPWSSWHSSSSRYYLIISASGWLMKEPKSFPGSSWLLLQSASFTNFCQIWNKKACLGTWSYLQLFSDWTATLQSVLIYVRSVLVNRTLSPKLVVIDRNAKLTIMCHTICSSLAVYSYFFFKTLCLAVDNFNLTRKIANFFWNNSWKQNGFALFSCWKL